MDVRVLILWHSGNIYQASIATRDLARMWNKMYSSKQECVNELYEFGLLTLVERYDALRSDIEDRDKMLVNLTTAEVQVLTEAGFVEIDQEEFGFG